MHAVIASFAASGRNEAPERRFKVREKTCCSLLHNRHPVTFCSTARHSMQAKNKPLSALFWSRAPGALLGGAVQPSKPFLSTATRPVKLGSPSVRSSSLGPIVNFRTLFTLCVL
jgi:hypothetical protein